MINVDKTIILMLGRIFSSANIMVLSILLARSLSKTDYGTYVQICMIIQLAAMLVSFGLPSSLTYYLPKVTNKGALILRTYLTINFIAIFSALLMVYFAPQISDMFNNSDIKVYVKYAAIGVIFNMVSLIARPIIMNNKDTLLLAKIEIFRSIIFICLMSVCVFKYKMVSYLIYIYIGCYFIDYLITFLVVAREVFRHSKLSVNNTLTMYEQFRYSTPLGMTVLCWHTGRELDKYVISHYMKPDDLAVYSRGAIELPLVHILANTISQIKLPDWVTQWDSGNIKSLIECWHSTIIKAALVLFPIFTLFQIIGSDFITLLYSAKYSQSVNIFHIYLFLLPLQITSYTAVVEATGNNRLVLVGYIIQLILSILASRFAINHFGWFGPAVVTIVGSYVWTAYILFIISNIFKTRIVAVFPWKKLAKIMLISILACILPFLFMLLTNESFSDIIKQKELLHLFNILTNSTLFVICYAFFAVKFALVDKEDIDIMTRWMLVAKVKRMFGNIGKSK